MLNVRVPRPHLSKMKAAIAECRERREILGGVKAGGPCLRSLCAPVAERFGVDIFALMDAYLRDTNRRYQAKFLRRARCQSRKDIYESLGMKKVRGALGGTYYE